MDPTRKVFLHFPVVLILERLRDLSNAIDFSEKLKIAIRNRSMPIAFGVSISISISIVRISFDRVSLEKGREPKVSRLIFFEANSMKVRKERVKKLRSILKEG